MIRSSDSFVGSGQPFRRETPVIPSVENPILSAEPLRPVRGDIRPMTKAGQVVAALREHGPLSSPRIAELTGIPAVSLSNVLKNSPEALIEHYIDNGRKRRMFYLEGQDPNAAIASLLAEQPAPAPVAVPVAVPVAPAPEPAPVAPEPVAPAPVPQPDTVAPVVAVNAKFAVWSDGSMTIRDTKLCCEVTLARNDAAALLEFVEQIKLSKWRTA